MSSGVGRKFHFIREIASGGFGSVFLAKVIHGDGFSRLAAIKLLHSKWSEDEEIASRMRDEARLLGWLRHRNIVDVLDLTVIDGRVAVIMEYLEAVDCKILINAAKRKNSLVPVRVALTVCAAVASALDAAYNRPPYAGEKPLHVIHRDIKPSNIMVDETGTAKVLDFGVARADFDARESHTKEISFGSMDYMPPERLFFEPDTPASDVYSLGATLYEMIALQKFGKAKLRPQDHEDYIFDRLEVMLQKHPIEDPDLGEELILLLKGMLAFDDAERPSAADCHNRMKELARKFTSEESLIEWSEKVVPGLVQEVMAKRAQQPPNPLVDKVMSEDSRGFERPDEEVTSAPPAVKGPGHEDDMTIAAPKEEARWTALKESTLAQMKGARGDESTAVRPMGPPPPGRGGVTPVESRPGVAAKVAPPPAVPRPPPPRSEDPAKALPDLGSTLDGLEPRGADQLGSSTTLRLQEHAPSEIETVIQPSPKELREISVSQGARASAVAPEEADEPEEPQGGGGSGLMIAGVLGTVLVAVVGLAALVVIVAVVFVSLSGPGTPAPAEASSTVAAPPPPPVQDAVPDKPSGPSAEFVSELADTKKLTVRCDAGEGEGKTTAFVPGPSPGECTVTAIDEKRKRRTAVVKDVKMRTYRCFQGEDSTCN